MSAGQPKRVVFICLENSNRSQMAEAFARMFGALGAAAQFIRARL
jgi:protein-tyrosine-phosphatase